MIASRHYSVVKRSIIYALRVLVRNHVYTSRNGLAKGLTRKGGLGFIPQIRLLSPEEKWLLGLDLSGHTIYDIGGYEGVFTLFFARAVGERGRVITFEPHPENYHKIRKNVEHNKFDNVMVSQIALGKTKGKAILASRHSDYGTASLHDAIKVQILRENRAKTFSVAVESLDAQINNNNLPEPDFVKIDVEGLEYDVLLGMSETIKRYKPKLFIEIHDVYLQSGTGNANNVADFLIPRGYSVYHVESRKSIAGLGLQTPKAGHFYCT